MGSSQALSLKPITSMTKRIALPFADASPNRAGLDRENVTVYGYRPVRLIVLVKEVDKVRVLLPA